MTQWFFLSINPDPWAIGPLGVGKRNGKYYPYVGRNQQLHAFKEAIADEMREVVRLPEGEYDLDLYFWRRLDEHDSGKKHVADATNLQKATEDALQEVLIGNDRDVRRIRSTLVEQGIDVRPAIVIRAQMWEGLDPTEIPSHIWESIDKTDTPSLFNNTWPPS